MTTRERRNSSNQTEDDLSSSSLLFLQRQLEVTDDIENSLERTLKRERLLEKLDELRTESPEIDDEA